MQKEGVDNFTFPSHLRGHLKHLHLPRKKRSVSTQIKCSNWKMLMNEWLQIDPDAHLWSDQHSPCCCRTWKWIYGLNVRLGHAFLSNPEKACALFLRLNPELNPNRENYISHNATGAGSGDIWVPVRQWSCIETPAVLKCDIKVSDYASWQKMRRRIFSLLSGECATYWCLRFSLWRRTCRHVIIFHLFCS